MLNVNRITFIHTRSRNIRSFPQHSISGVMMKLMHLLFLFSTSAIATGAPIEAPQSCNLEQAMELPGNYTFDATLGKRQNYYLGVSS